MISALPETFSKASRRANIVLLLIGGAVAGFGLGALVLVMTLPLPEVTPLPPIAARPLTPPDEPALPPTSRPWAAAFGLAPVPAPVQPMEEPQESFAPDEPELEDDTDTHPETDYRLRGMVNEGGGGWALIEGEMGVEVVRVGSVLSGGESVIEITPDGVVLQGYGAEFLLSFSELESEAGNGLHLVGEDRSGR